MPAIDAWFFGASASTESGLNTIDVKDLKTYQQLYIYFIPILTNLGFINIVVVIVRLFWFKRYLKRLAPQALHDSPAIPDVDIESAQHESKVLADTNENSAETTDESNGKAKATNDCIEEDAALANEDGRVARTTTITFDPSTERHKEDDALYIPGPRARDRGYPIAPRSHEDGRHPDDSDDDDAIKPVPNETHNNGSSSMRRRRRFSNDDGLKVTAFRSMDRVAGVTASFLVLGSQSEPQPRPISSYSNQQPAINDVPFLSRQATLGRNSQFKNLTSHDREILGGIEYRSLKLLLKIVVVYFFGLHIFGVVCLVGWIHTADKQYADILQSSAQDKTWWGIYSAQTMYDNLGFTLTPDSMISFRTAKWPMILMSFLAFAGNTLYPVFLRLSIWIMSNLVPKTSPTQESLAFLLTYPRRCYTLLFPSGPTWILFGIIFALNFIDILLIIVLDLSNPEVASLPLSQRIPAAIFQAASARHTGTASFNLANVSPAVQLSLLIMMYIAVFPIAISIRASNAYEEKSLGLWEEEKSLDEKHSKTYLLTHMKNQLGFDLWYIFLGTFCICISESTRIADVNEPAFSVFSVLFEVTSAYGNVGLSLGYPTVSTSLCGMFGTFGKAVICLMMIRGRHRGLPYALDRAIMLPTGQIAEN
ncbi:probable potassium transporter TRK-1 [Fusarium mangiferae]|uniref:Probable potassium transporter TRK-1 n=1 Tax=Fusarium mangiferae TaxID=192010 RepID=A0A1L7UED8_FUSMA|nr:putative potassium transporter TRK-1 [Fusarium mangiferae]CVL08809.1 probable potassium transporter TRK-1 [Fusarium mangiferae]